MRSDNKLFYFRLEPSQLLSALIQIPETERGTWITQVAIELASGSPQNQFSIALFKEAENFKKNVSERNRLAGLASAEKRKRMSTGVQRTSTHVEQVSTKPNPVTEAVTEAVTKQKPKPLPPEEAMTLASLLADLMLGNNPKNAGLSTDEKKKDAVDRWASEIEKLHRLDHQSWEDIRTVIEWSQKDSFWRKNILSGATLREKYDRLAIDAIDSEPVVKHKYGNPIFDGGI